MNSNDHNVPKLSLCIPTLDRFDKFLSKNLPNYLINDYIDEIVISDENGKDIQKISQFFKDSKLKLFSNDRVLEAFLNKDKVVSLAKNNWIVLMDSDNYAPQQYFEAWEKHIAKFGLDDNMIYMPAGWLHRPNMYFDMFHNTIFTKNNVRNYFNEGMWNNGNYIFNKKSYLGAKNNYEYLIPLCYSLDVIYKNAILLENNVHFSLVENMLYEHAMHEGSYYSTTSRKAEPHRQSINSIFFNFR
jgi:hypothetical protein